MTDIEKIRAAIDDPSLELLAWADLEEEDGNAARARGLRKLAEGKREPSRRPHKRWGWRFSRYSDSREAIFKRGGLTDLLPRFGTSQIAGNGRRYPSVPFHAYDGFTSKTDALVAAADYIGKCLEIRDALVAAARPAAG